MKVPDDELIPGVPRAQGFVYEAMQPEICLVGVRLGGTLTAKKAAVQPERHPDWVVATGDELRQTFPSLYTEPWPLRQRRMGC